MTDSVQMACGGRATLRAAGLQLYFCRFIRNPGSAGNRTLRKRPCLMCGAVFYILLKIENTEKWGRSDRIVYTEACGAGKSGS